jgi:tetratricopeptide (TPR) repeat protein
MLDSSQSIPNRRLDSWKKIASFLDRDERTVRRWEKKQGLPVHRIPSGSKGRVYAYENELDQWLSASRHLEPDHLKEQEPVATFPPESESLGPANPPSPASAHSQIHPAGKWLAVLALCFGVAATLNLYRTGQRFAVHASPSVSETTDGKANGAMHGIASGTKGVTVAGTPTPPAAHVPNSGAENLYLEGRYYWNRRTPEDLNRAVDYFTRAVNRDPNYSKAYVGLADSYNLLREYSAMPAGEAYPLALAAASKAVQLDENSAEAHTSLAFVSFFWSWDAPGAEREFKRALDLNPGDARAHHWYASFLLTCRRFPESLAEIEKAQRLDPSSVAILADKAQILQVSGRSDQGLALLKQIETTDPSFASAHRYLSEIYFFRQDYPNYLSELKTTALLLHDSRELDIAIAAEHGFQTAGYNGMLVSTLAVQQKLNSEQALSGFHLAVTYARMHRKKDALLHLTGAYEQHDCLVLQLATEPSFNVLHEEPEYKSLVARIFPSAAFSPQGQ